MRVISGRYKGRKLNGFLMPGTRPTMDRVKESLFSMLGNNIKGSQMLDLFAGSGSLGVEALSNGARMCYFNELDKNMYKILESNLLFVEKNTYKTYNMNYLSLLKYCKNENIKFDYIILDPPYKLNLINNILDEIKSLNLLNNSGQVICEYEDEIIDNENYEIIKEKSYGSKHIKILMLKD